MKIAVKYLPVIYLTIGVLLFSQCYMAEAEEVNSGFSFSYTGVANPERGWYISLNTKDASQSQMARIKRANVTIVFLEADLGAYLAGPLDSYKLNEIRNAFSLARNAGLSVIYRAAYTFDEILNPDPKNFDIIQGHINQLKPVFYENEDILFNVQAGFFGPWGEWHSSNYSTNTTKLYYPVKPEYQRMLGNALLEAVPKSVTIAVRRPEYIRNIADENAVNNDRGDHAPVSDTEAFGNSKIARLAFHNDALMSDDTDMDTYIDPNYSRDKELNWINKQTRYTPMVAETNRLSRYNLTTAAIPLLDRINIQSLNMEYHPEILKRWYNSTYENMNALAYIGMMMGYRFVLDTEKTTLSQLNGEDGILLLNLELKNTGFGHLLKEKVFEIVLKKDQQIYRALINEDARLWDKNTAIVRQYRFSLPSGFTAGNWDVYLGLSSTYDSLKNNPSFSVRFANEGLWDGNLGLNKIRTMYLDVPGNGGESDFKQILTP